MAPSPTGLLHLGHVRTFRVAWARARACSGVLRLRIDDLDPGRSRAEYGKALVEDLHWLGLDWDGSVVFQSARMPAYRGAWERLVADGWVFPCWCSRRDLLGAVGAPHGEGVAGDRGQPGGGRGDEAVYPGTCRPQWMPGKAAGVEDRARWLAGGPDGVNWRFRVPDGERVCWVDGGRGAQCFTAGLGFGDFAVWRRDGVPAYQLATVVDDGAMGVTEVVRGADLLVSTARQILLTRALGYGEPQWFHCPLVADERGARLAKRADALSVRALRDAGWSPGEVMARAMRADVV